MQVNRVNNNNFKGLNTTKATSALFKRLNTPERYERFFLLQDSQTKNPLEILILEGKHNSLSGQITDKEGNLLYSANESAYKGIFNLSPIKFLKNLCKQANKLNSGK